MQEDESLPAALQNETEKEHDELCALVPTPPSSAGSEVAEEAAALLQSSQLEEEDLEKLRLQSQVPSGEEECPFFWPDEDGPKNSPSEELGNDGSDISEDLGSSGTSSGDASSAIWATWGNWQIL